MIQREIPLPRTSDLRDKDRFEFYVKEHISDLEAAPITFTVTGPGVEVAVPHKLGSVPSSALHLVAPSATGQGVVYSGATAWTALVMYLTATAAGDYAAIARR